MIAVVSAMEITILISYKCLKQINFQNCNVGNVTSNKFTNNKWNTAAHKKSEIEFASRQRKQFN